MQKIHDFHKRFHGLSGVLFLSTLLSVVAALSSGSCLHAQVDTGINGNITDSTGAVIVGAQVTVTNTSTSVVSHAVTSSAGTFTVVGLIPGRYAVTVEAAAFKTGQTDVTVEIARMSTVNFQMVPGATTSTVRVQANTIT